MDRVKGEMVLDPATGRMRPARRVAQATAPDTGGEAATNAGLLLLFVIVLLIPGSFSLAGLNLPFFRIVLIFLVVPLTLRLLQDKEHPINAVDVLMVLYIAWTALAVLVNHGSSRIIYIGSTAIDQFGAYLVGRMLIRHAVDYRLFFTYLFGALVFLAPFAFLELVSRILPIYDVVGLFANVSRPGGGDLRAGFFRVRTVFAHPISFGVFCSIAIANLFYVFKDSFPKRWGGALLASVLTLTSLSTGPLIGLALSWGAIAWEHVSRLIPGRWVLLGVLVVLSVALVELTVPGGLYGLILEEVAYSQQSGRGRLEIIEYAGAEVLRNPLFGIGFNDWVRPFWRNTSSIDNFYLVLGVRSGIPVLVFFVGALLLHMALIVRSTYKARDYNPWRQGYLISLAAVGVVLGSVHIWGAMDVFFLTLIGAGHWFYSPRQVGTADRTRTRLADSQPLAPRIPNKGELAMASVPGPIRPPRRAAVAPPPSSLATTDRKPRARR